MLRPQNPEKIEWGYLSSNPNPNAIHLLEQNPEKINLSRLLKNPGAIHLIETYRNFWVLPYLWGNPAIFDDVYEPPVLK